MGGQYICLKTYALLRRSSTVSLKAYYIYNKPNKDDRGVQPINTEPYLQHIIYCTLRMHFPSFMSLYSSCLLNGRFLVVFSPVECTRSLVPIYNKYSVCIYKWWKTLLLKMYSSCGCITIATFFCSWLDVFETRVLNFKKICLSQNTCRSLNVTLTVRRSYRGW